MKFVKFLKDNIIGIFILGIVASLAASYIYENYIKSPSEPEVISSNIEIDQNNSNVSGNQRNIEVNDNGNYIEGDHTIVNDYKNNYNSSSKELEKTSPYDLTEAQAFELARRLSFNSQIEKELVKKVSIEGQPPIIVFLNYIHESKEDFVLFNVSKYTNGKWILHRKDTIRQKTVHFYHRLSFYEDIEKIDKKDLFSKDVKVAFVASCIQRHQCHESASVIVYYPNIDKLHVLIADKNGDIKLPFGVPENPKDLYYFEFIAQKTKNIAFFQHKILNYHLNLSKITSPYRMLPNYMLTLREEEIENFKRLIGSRNKDDYRIIGIYLDDIFGDGSLKWVIHAGWNEGRGSHWGVDDTHVLIKDVNNERLVENVVKGYKKNTGMHGHSFEVISHIEEGIPHLTFFYIDGGNSDFYFSNIYMYKNGVFARKKDEVLSQKLVTRYYPHHHYNHF